MASPIMRDPQYGGRLSMVQPRMQQGGIGQPRTGMVKEVPQEVPPVDDMLIEDFAPIEISEPASEFGRVLVPDSGYTPSYTTSQFPTDGYRYTPPASTGVPGTQRQGQQQVDRMMQSPEYQALLARRQNSQGQDQEANQALQRYEQQLNQPAIGFGPAGPNGGWSSTSGGGYNIAGQYDPNMPPGYGTEYMTLTGPVGNQNPILPTGGNPYDGGSSVDDKVYGGLGLTGLLSGNLGDALRTAGGYYAGQQGIEGAYQTGLTGLETAERMGQRALEGTQFKPFGVTSDLANVQVGAQGDVNLGLSGQQQRLQNQLLGRAGQMAGSIGSGYDPRTGQVGRQAMGQAQQQIGQVGAYDPSIAAQRGAMGGLFGQQLGQFGQPTGLEGVTQAGLTGAQQQFGRAGQPSDLNQLRGQFAGQVGGLLSQQPSESIGQLGQQAFQLGREGLSQLGAPSDIENLRSQYGNLALQAGQGLLTSPEQRQSDIYESIRATQRPEEERQALRMRENLLAQGRAGVRTADYGGTPEQLAMAKAQAEAQAGAALRAREMGMAEQQQGLQTAQTLTGMASGLAGTSSDLQSAQQNRAQQLSQLGLNTQQIESQLQSEGLSRGVTAGTTAGQLAGMASDLETAGIGRGATLAGVGMQGAQTGRGFGQQDLQNLMALQGADIGAAQAQQALQQGRLGLGTGLFGLGQQAQMMPSQLQGADIQNMQALLGAGYMPQQQALNLLQAGMPAAEMSQRGQIRGTELQTQMGQTGLESYMQGANMANVLQQQQLQGMLQGALGQGITPQEQLLALLSGRDPQADGGLLGALGVGESKTPSWIKAIGDSLGFGGGSALGSSADNALIESIIGTAGTKQSDSTKGMLDAFNALGIGGG